jgi:hypothetical protein
MSDFALMTMGSSAETRFFLNDYTPSRKYESNQNAYFVPMITLKSMPSSSSSISIRENYDEYSIVDNFVTKLAQSSKDLEPEIYKLVNSKFWDLL